MHGRVELLLGLPISLGMRGDLTVLCSDLMHINPSYLRALGFPTPGAYRSPGKRRTTKFMPPITQETQGIGEMEITPLAPAGDQVSKTAPVTTTATTPSRRKSGQQPEQPCLITHHSPPELRLEPSMPIALYWRKTGSVYRKSKPPSRNVYSPQNNLASDGRAPEEAPPEAVTA